MEKVAQKVLFGLPEKSTKVTLNLDKGHLSGAPAIRTPSLIRGTPSSTFQKFVLAGKFYSQLCNFRSILEGVLGRLKG